MSDKKFEKLTLTLNSEGDRYEVTDCEKDAVEVRIPKEVDGIPVLGIGDRAFEDCTMLRSVIFPDEVLIPKAEIDESLEVWEIAMLELESRYWIGANAFMGCTSLIEIYLPDYVTVIGHGAFYHCHSLTSVRFGKDTYLEPYAFSNCRSLCTVSVTRYASEGAFSHCMSLTSLPITDDVDTICEDAFEHCYGLTEITIPASVTRIESLAFRNCRGLTRVTFESPEGWVGTNRYMMGKKNKLDLSDPERNARWLSGMDFDDGVIAWFKDNGEDDSENSGDPYDI